MRAEGWGGVGQQGLVGRLTREAGGRAPSPKGDRAMGWAWGFGLITLKARGVCRGEAIHLALWAGGRHQLPTAALGLARKVGLREL